MLNAGRRRPLQGRAQRLETGDPKAKRFSSPGGVRVLEVRKDGFGSEAENSIHRSRALYLQLESLLIEMAVRRSSSCGRERGREPARCARQPTA